MQVENQSNVARTALTLVELLVTITIMGLVIAVSIPMIKPMLESNKVKNGADVVSGFLAQARNRAMEEGRPVGVTFERVLNYGDGETYFPYNGASILMRQVAEPKPLSGFFKDVRVAVNWAAPFACNLTFHTWDGTSWVPANAEGNYWRKLVKSGDQIQFNAQGPKYTITGSPDPDSPRDFILDMTPRVDNPNRNFARPPYRSDQPVLFQVFRKPQPDKVAPTMAVPVALPEGIVVDLDSSGMGRNFYNAQMPIQLLKPNEPSINYVRDDFCAINSSDRSTVTIMFSPTGEVDRVYFNQKPSNPGTGGIIPSEPIFLCIGIWERAGFWEGNTLSVAYLPEDVGKIRNYHDMNNYWVTIFPRTGDVRVNRVANVSDTARFTSGVFKESRKYANSLHGQETR